jgi:hypothetical protein
MSNIKYFTDSNGSKFVVEQTTETGFVVHKVAGAGETVGKSFEIGYDDILSDYKIDAIKFFPESVVSDLDALFVFIKTAKRDAKTNRLEREEAERAKQKEQAELDSIAEAKRKEIELAERKRKAKALKLKLELENE